MNEIKCYIEDHYKIDHSQVDDNLRTKFVTVGKLFQGKPICVWCLQRLSIVADCYGYHRMGNIRGGTNVEARVPLKEFVNRSPLKPVFKDYDLTDIKFNIDKNLFEIEPEQPIQPPLQSEIDRISGARTVREV